MKNSDKLVKSQIVSQIGEGIADSDWHLVELTEDFRVWEAVTMIDGEPITVRKREYLADELIQKANQQEYNDTEGQSFGDGFIGGRIPLNVLFDPKNQLVEKLQEGDRDHLSWFMDRDENRIWKTRKGKF